MVSIVLAACLVSAQSGPAAHLLRFHPAIGLRLTREFRLETRVQVDSAGTTRTREAEARGRMQQVAAHGYAGATVLHLALDSVTVRERDNAMPWSDARPYVGGWRQIEVDDRLTARVTGAQGPQTATRLMEWMAVGLAHLVLPERAVRPGAEWRQWIRVPRGLPKLPDGPWLDIPVRVVVRLDSIAATPADSLFYFDVRGEGMAVDARAATAPDELGVAATLVWSSGWSAYVAQAVRIEVASEGAAPGGDWVRASLSTVLQSRARSIP